MGYSSLNLLKELPLSLLKIGQIEQLSNAMVISLLKLGMAMKRLDKNKVTQFLNISAGAAIKYPNVARIIATWVDGGDWEDLEGLAQMAWRQTSMPV